MFDFIENPSGNPVSDLAVLLEAFDQPNEEQIELRRDLRVDHHALVTIEPGNQSERGRWQVEATTIDVSNGGCRVISSAAVLPGDLFALTFDENQLAAGTAIASCQRCSVLRPGVFEAAFTFLSKIDVEHALANRKP